MESPTKRQRREEEEASQQLDEVLAQQELLQAIEGANSLLQLAGALACCEKHLGTTATAAVFRLLPRHMAKASLPKGITDEALAARLDTGEAFEAPALPSRWPDDLDERNHLWRCPGDEGVLPSRAGAAVFLRAHDCVEEVLDDARKRSAVSLSFLADVAAFYGALRPGPPLPGHVFEDSADEALRRLRCKDIVLDGSDLGHISRIARGVAQSGALMRHGIYAALSAVLARRVAEVDRMALHNCALSLALTRPWDASSQEAASALLAALPLAPPQEAPPESTSLACIGGSSVAGERAGETKENQDRFLAFLQGEGACLAVVDGHGKRGAAVATSCCERLRRALPGLLGRRGEEACSKLGEQVMLTDTAQLLDPKVDAELSGAACVAACVQGIGKDSPPEGRCLLVAHLGDCRAIIGRCEGSPAPGETQRWRVVRATQDHRPGDVAEAERLIAAGARVRRAGPATQGPGPANLGPPRIWHRMAGLAPGKGGPMCPGLALSHGLGDALGQGCGLSVEATVSEVPLDQGDAVIVIASDGVYDALTDAEVLHCCRVFWQGKKATEAAAAVTAAAGRIWAARGSYRDDATCVVLFL